MEKKCKYCSKVFNSSREHMSYCSYECRKSYDREYRASKWRVDHGLTYPYTTRCRQCGTDITVTAGHTPLYCSSDCRNASDRRRRSTKSYPYMKQCKQCGFKFEVTNSHETIRKYCSLDCRRRFWHEYEKYQRILAKVEKDKQKERIKAYRGQKDE